MLAPFELSKSLISSNLLSISSGLELSELIEVIVFRLSPTEEDRLGCGTMASTFAEGFLESHEEKPVPNFFAAGAGNGFKSVALPVGGGPHGIDGKLLARPLPLKGIFGGDDVFLSRPSGDIAAPPVTSSVISPPRLMSSREEVEVRWEVRRWGLDVAVSVERSEEPSVGLIVGTALPFALRTGTVFEVRGVDVEDEGSPCVKERGREVVDFRDCCDSGRDEVSGASSKVSYIASANVPRNINHGLHTPSLSELSALDSLRSKSAMMSPSHSSSTASQCQWNQVRRLWNSLLTVHTLRYGDHCR